LFLTLLSTELAAAVSNAGGCGVIGGVGANSHVAAVILLHFTNRKVAGYTPDFLRKQIAALKVRRRLTLQA
jgi:hypothetical protein